MTASSYPQHSVLLNCFLLFANVMNTASHNSLICISLVKSEIKPIFICLSTFMSWMFHMFHRLLFVISFLLLICRSYLCIKEFNLHLCYELLFHSIQYFSFLVLIPIFNGVFIYDYFLMFHKTKVHVNLLIIMYWTPSKMLNTEE